MGEIVDISTLKKEFEQKTKAKDLKEFAIAQQSLIEKLNNELSIEKEKNYHLETMLKDIAKSGVVTQISPEEMICVEQISLLKQKSSSRNLTLEEAKQLDIFVRNLKLIRDESTVIINSIDSSGIKEAELVAIATGRAAEETDKS